MFAPDKNLLIVFDLVSTLNDAGPRYVRAFQEACETMGFIAPEDEEVMAALGEKNLSQIVDSFIGKLEPQQKAAFMEKCNTTCDAMLQRPDWKEALFPHVADAVERLHARGVTLGIFTGTREDAMVSQLAYHGITEMFDPRYMRGKNNERDGATTHSEDIKTAQLRSIREQFRKDQGRDDVAIVVIGDSEADAKAAQNLGLFFVGFASCERKKDRLESVGLKTMVTDFADLPDLVDWLRLPPQALQSAKPAPFRPR